MPYEMEKQRFYQKEQEEIRRDMREIEKTRVKAEITENIRTQAQEVRRQNKERADERKRGQYTIAGFFRNQSQNRKYVKRITRK